MIPKSGARQDDWSEAPYTLRFSLSTMISWPTISLGAVVLSLLVWWRKRSSVVHLSLPPGPKKLPLIGNLLDMPKGKQWIAYQRWAKEYGT
jgi:hypothetical protein